jgi:glycosyltransferase involved in cell wall biosynthesis
MRHGFIFPGEAIGGHEMMAAKIISALKLNAKSVVIVSSRSMYAKLVQYIGVDYEHRSAEFSSFRFESTLGYLNPNYFRNRLEARRVIVGLNSATIVVGGVNAHHSTVLGIGSACSALDIDSRVYIPMFHYPHEMAVSALTGFSNLLSAKRVFKLFNKVLTIDEYWADRVTTFAKRSELEVQVIHNFLANREQNPTPFEGARELKRICVVGRMDKEQKGMDLLLRILREVSASSNVPKHTWVFIGDGPHLPEIRKFAEECQNPNLLFEIHGWRSDSLALIQTCNALALTSRWEGIPTVVAEALLLKLRVFAFDIAAIDRLLVEDELVPCFDISAYSSKIVSYLAEEKSLSTMPRPYLQMMCDEFRFQEEANDLY